MTAIEGRWLDYAIALLNDANHRTICVANNGALGDPHLDPDLRWPGYIKPQYESARPRILCVAQVHHAGEFRRTLGHAEPILRRLRELQRPYGSTAAKALDELRQAM